MLHDPNTYHDPFDFKPERFLSGPGRKPERDPSSIMFGFGRRYLSIVSPQEYKVLLISISFRICPGKNMAETTVFLAIAMTLACFDIQKARDSRGQEIEPRHEMSFEFMKCVVILFRERINI